jgi:hypothetical protein
MRIAAILRNVLVAGVTAWCLALLASPPTAAAPVSVPFAMHAGDSSTFSVHYLRATTMAGAPAPVIAVDYEMELKITGVAEQALSATVRNTGMNITIDRQRVVAPPDFDSLLLAALDGVTAELEISADGAPVRVTNWETLRPLLTDKAKALAGDNQAMIETLDAFLPKVSDVDAVQILARPLALSAAGRVATFDPPQRTSLEAGKLRLPSFATYAAGRWSFDLAPNSELPNSVTISWLGVPGAEDLKAILSQAGEQANRMSPLSDETRSEIENNGQMWQRFSATYDDRDGRLLKFQGVMELKAGPLERRIALEAVAKGQVNARP